MAIDIIARGLATSLVGADGKIDSSKMPVLGEVPEGTTFYPIGQLSNPDLVAGKTAEEILLMMLYGVVTPTLTDPKLSLALSAENEQLIIGRPSVVKGALSFSRGKIDPAFGTSGNRSGAALSYTVNGETVVASGNSYDFEFEILPTTDTISIGYSVNYAQGEQPMNSIGQPYGAPLTAGSISSSFDLNAAYPLYDKDGEDIRFTWFKEDDGEGYLANFATETTTFKQHFMVSEQVNVIGIKSFDTMTQQWTWLGGETAEVSLTYFDTTQIAGESLDEKTNYTLFTHNYLLVGDRELRIYIK